jgi:FkbM family methyltransferase
MAIADHVFRVVPDRVMYTGLAWQYLVMERELRALDDFYPRDVAASTVAIDCGAWWGPWTYWLSRRAGRVVSLEPVPHVAEFLRRVVGNNVEIVCTAASDHAGTSMLYLPPSGLGSEGRSTVEPSLAVDGATSIEVALTPIDALEVGDVGLIKIDVEGHERVVLRGAAQTIARYRPVLVIEIEERGGVTVADTFVALDALGYDGWFLLDKQWQPRSRFDVVQHQASKRDLNLSRGYLHNLVRGTGGYVNNFVFLPKGAPPFPRRAA